jgi:rhodanese-related sulfurtransferase
MNGRPQTVPAPARCAGTIPWRQVVALPVAAVALGLVYNVASPLGVRAPRTESQEANPLVHSSTSSVPAVAPVSTNPVNATTVPATTNAVALRWAEVKPLLAAGQIVLVDARARAAYDIEHIPGAVSLPVISQPAEFLAFAVKYPKDTAIVVYCGSDNCDLSHTLAEKLRNDLGYTHVKEMPGGIAEWRVAEGRITQSGPK